MKKILLVAGFLVLFISCADSKKKTEEKLQDVTELSLTDFDSKAGEYIGKTVQVKGIVDHVCKHGGKKILLVNDDADVHVESETRFDDSLVGDEIIVQGKVAEFRVDEAYILKKEEDHLQNHKEGKDTKEIYDKKMKQLQFFRDSMQIAHVDHLSFYSLDYVSHVVSKEGVGKASQESEAEEKEAKE